MEKEAEEERMRRQRAAVEKAFQDGITKAKLVMRRTPLGTDRNHNRLVLHPTVYTQINVISLSTFIITTVSWCFCSDTGFSLMWFLVCTSRKAGCMKASTTTSPLHQRKNQLSPRLKRKRTVSRLHLRIHKVQ